MSQVSIDINQNYFYMPFGPILSKPEEYGLAYLPNEDMLFQRKTNSKWKEVLLYNTGWGRPNGFERMPQLSFNCLMELALRSDSQNTKLKIFEEESNKYGAIATIMDRHVNELVEFLSRNLNNQEFFRNQLYKQNLKYFCFDAKRAGTNGGDGLRSYEDILNEHKKWLEISSKVKELVYF